MLQFRFVEAKWWKEVRAFASRDLQVMDGKIVYICKDCISSPKGKASRFIRNFDGPFIVTGHPHNRSDLLTVRNVLTGESVLCPVNTEKVVVVPDPETDIDIVERTEGAQDELAKGEERRERNAEKEKETAEDVRKRSMERLSQTRERESPESAKKKRKCSSPGDTVEYLKEKSERELEIRREEIELKKREMALKEREAEREWELKRKEQDLREREVEQRMRDQEARNKKDVDMVAILQQQLQQQQAMFQQMQQQNQILFEFMKNTLEKK